MLGIGVVPGRGGRLPAFASRGVGPRIGAAEP
jgi:hypothetical protein